MGKKSKREEKPELRVEDKLWIATEVGKYRAMKVSQFWAPLFKKFRKTRAQQKHGWQLNSVKNGVSYFMKSKAGKKAVKKGYEEVKNAKKEESMQKPPKKKKRAALSSASSSSASCSPDSDVSNESSSSSLEISEDSSIPEFSTSWAEDQLPDDAPQAEMANPSTGFLLSDPRRFPSMPDL